MKRNEKGFTLVEIIVTFCLISTISFLLFQIILSLKNLYTSSDYKTVLLIDQGNLTRRMNDDFFDLTLQKIDTCSDAKADAKLCLQFTFLDYSSRDEKGDPVQLAPKKLEVLDSTTDAERKIIYDGYAMTLAKGSTFGDVQASISYIADDSMRYNAFLTIDVPLTNKLSTGDFGLHFTAQFYAKMNESGEAPLTNYNELKQEKGLTEEVKRIDLTTFTVHDLIRRVLEEKEGKYMQDGLYNIASKNWHVTDKDFPKYVYKGANPNNSVVMGDLCFRIMQITNENGMKLVYDGTYANNTCTTSSTAFKTSIYGTDNNWLNSSLRNTALKDAVLNKNMSTNSNFFYGSLKRPTSTTEDTYERLIQQTMHEKGNTAIPSLENNYYGDHAKNIGVPTILDYILSSRSEGCTGVTAATDNQCESNNFLTKPYSYWTMTADGENGYVWEVNRSNIMSSPLNATNGVLPVVYLKPSTIFTLKEGSTGTRGSKSNPYIVSE